MSIQYLHTMVRVSDIDASLKFFCDGLGLTEVSHARFSGHAGRCRAYGRHAGRRQPDPDRHSDGGADL